MDLAIILMSVGIVCMIVSFFFKDRAKKVERDLEDLSINIYQETNSLKRRLKMVEEELMLEPTVQFKGQKVVSPPPIQTTATQKPIHNILISQVIELNKQGLSIEEISQRSTLSHDQIHSILGGGA